MENTLQNISWLKNTNEITVSSFSEYIENVEFKNKVIKNEKYVSVYRFLYESNKRWIQGFIIIPKNFDENKKYPCIVTNRGGTRDFGSIKLGSLFAGYFAWPALVGYISITTNLDPEDKLGDTQDTDDILRLYDVLKEIPQADLSNIGMFGWSRGGQAVYQCLRRNVSWIKNAISIAGVADHIEEIKYRPGWKEHCEKIFGGSEKELIARSALYWSNEMKDVPLLLIHGKSDDRVSYLDSVKLNEKLLNSRLVIYEDGDHGLENHINEVKTLCSDWWKEYLEEKQLLDTRYLNKVNSSKLL